MFECALLKEIQMTFLGIVAAAALALATSASSELAVVSSSTTPGHFQIQGKDVHPHPY